LLVERLRSPEEDRTHAARQYGGRAGTTDGELVKVQIRTKSAAAFRILKGLDGKLESVVGTLFNACIPIAVGDFFYSIVARNRYRLFGKSAGIVCRRVPKKKPQAATPQGEGQPAEPIPPSDTFESRIWNGV
jgi:hypothetical protein